jgi:hypothetical protein
MRRGVLATILCAIVVAAPASASAATPIQIQSLSPDRYFSPNGLAVRGGRLRATWHKLRGAKAYRVAVRVSDGRRLLYLDVSRPALTVPRIPRGTRVTVQVRADGLLGGKPPVATKSLTARR